MGRGQTLLAPWPPDLRDQLLPSTMPFESAAEPPTELSYIHHASFPFLLSDHLMLLSAPFRLVLPARILCQWPTPSHELMILGLDSQQDCSTCLHHYCDS